MMAETRRDFVQIALRAAALPGALPWLAAWLQAGQAHVHGGEGTIGAAPTDASFLSTYQPKFFDADDFKALQAFTEILIPTDETPGAREAYCAHYIDFLLSSAEDVPSLQKDWRSALARLRQLQFHTADAETRAALVKQMSSPQAEDYPVFHLIKRTNTFAFYTSRAGLIENLDYRGYSYNETFPACTHPEHQQV